MRLGDDFGEDVIGAAMDDASVRIVQSWKSRMHNLPYDV